MSSIRISGVVTAHPRRRDVAQALVNSLPPGVFDLVLDPRPDQPVSLRTAMLAWSSAADDATHHIVLEDDAAPVPDFLRYAEEAAAAAPDAAIAFYANWNSRNGGAVRMAALAGSRWAPAASEYTPVVALMLPADVAAGFADYARTHGDTWADDVVMSRYLADRGVRALLTVPSLVQHGDLPSLSGNDFHGLRMAACTSPPPAGGDWDDVPESPYDVLPFFASGIAQCQVRYEGRPLSVGRERFGPRIGIDHDTCVTAYEEALRSMPDTATYLWDAVGSKALLEFWYAAYTLGVLGRQTGDGDTAPLLTRWMADPMVREAISTLGPGGFCTTLSAVTLLRARPFLADLGLVALLAGARAEPAPRRARAAVVVGPAWQPLSGTLVSELCDRGYHAVTTVSGGTTADAAVHVTPLPAPDAPLAADDAWPVGVSRLLLLDPTGRWAGTTVTETVGGRSVTRLYLGVPYGPELGAYSQVDILVDQALRRRTMTARRGPALPLVHGWDIAGIVHGLLSGDPVTFGAAPVVTPERLAEVVHEMVHPVPVEFLAGDDETLDGPPTAVGWEPPTSLREGIRTVCQWQAYESVLERRHVVPV